MTFAARSAAEPDRLSSQIGTLSTAFLQQSIWRTQLAYFFLTVMWQISTRQSAETFYPARSRAPNG
jgi:hypothetical protein